MPSQLIKNQPVYFLLNTYAYMGLLSGQKILPGDGFKKRVLFKANKIAKSIFPAFILQLPFLNHRLR